MISGQPSPIADDEDEIAGAVLPRPVSTAYLVRIGLLGLSLLVIGGYAFNRIMRPASPQGVINAPMVTLRAPIDGQLVRGGASIGQTILPGTELFAVRDPRVDEHHARELKSRVDEARQRVTALDTILKDLDRMSSELTRRTAYFASAEETRLRASVSGNNIAIANAMQTLTFAKEREKRLRRLVSAGTAVEQRLEEAVRIRLMARAALDRSIAERQTNAAALVAAHKQIFVLNGFGGTAYAQQRADEIEVRRLELVYQRSVAQSQVTSLQSELEAEVAHDTSLREVAVPSAIGGVVAAVYVAPGTDVQRGVPLADVLDCSALYIEATVSTGWFVTPHPGDPVRVTLYGGGATLDGRIRTLRDTAMALDPGRGVPLSDRETRQTLTAIIDIDPRDIAMTPGGGCPVGQPASVRFR